MLLSGGGVGGTTIYGLGRNVPLHRVWLWRVSNVTFRLLCYVSIFSNLFKLKQTLLRLWILIQCF